MLILISPAKSLNYESSLSDKNFSLPYFEKETQELVKELKKFQSSDLEKIMKISKKLADLNFERFQNFSSKFDLKNSKQAIFVFDGDVYKPIELEKFNKNDFEFLQKNLRILSGFYGILKPFDLMQPYRLEMGTDFKNTSLEQNLKIKNLYQFWGDKIANYLDKETKENGDEYIVNLASEEYFLAVNENKIEAKIINIVFKEKKNGSYKIIGINAKKARGLMVNFIVKNHIKSIVKLKEFDCDGYSFSKEMSDKKNFVFIR
ncbi:MAG: peroxide stress protein YaaA [Pelagibacterales bacterium]|nr:peroxide stress protein YaaA [Pelagibacterales bacterium]